MRVQSSQPTQEYITSLTSTSRPYRKIDPISREVYKPPVIDKVLLNQLKNTADEPRHTIIHCLYTAPEKYFDGGWVCISQKTYLVGKGANGILPLLHAVNIPIEPAVHYFNRSGEKLIFTLLFPWVPESWLLFDLFENSGKGSFKISDIAREESGVYHLKIYP